MPDRGRHGADEDRVSAPLPPTAPALGARPADCLSATLCALRRARSTIAECEKPHPLTRQARRTDVWPQRQSQTAALGLAFLPRSKPLPLPPEVGEGR